MNWRTKLLLNRKAEGTKLKRSNSILGVALVLISLTSIADAAERAGTIKTLKGSVNISRVGESLDVKVGDAVMAGDTLTTEALSFAGITLRDNTRLTAGPSSSLVIDQFSFDTTTHQGRLNTSVKKGSLAVVSGQLAKANPESVSFNTGSMTLGVRGTEFIIEVAGEQK